MSVRVAIVDSGIDAGRIGVSLHAERDFVGAAAGTDASGHGTAVARLVLAEAPAAVLIDARIFGAGKRCDAGRVVAAIEWALESGVDVINLSFGQSQPNAALRLACEAADRAGAVLVASAAARGGPVFPAVYANCLAVAGDARCMPGELSWLGAAGIDFGSCPARDDKGAAGGASFAAARVAGVVARCRAAGVPAARMAAHLRSLCRHLGPERRMAGG